MLKYIQKSVREIVEYVYLSGSLISQSKSARYMQEGVRLHQKLQNDYPSDSLKEHSVSFEYQIDNHLFNISGKMDGIHFKPLIIEEIKSTLLPLSDLEMKSNMAHYAQLSFYSYFYVVQNSLNEIIQRITYIHRESEETVSFDETISKTELKIFFHNVLAEYKRFIDFNDNHHIKSINSLKELSFPYESYRAGQHDMAKIIYLGIKRSKNTYIQAPCGIGKTISSIFPATKAIGENLVDKIIYCTSKNTQKQIAISAVTDLINNNAQIRCIELTAKDKMCALEKRDCDPDKCKYANDYFSKLKAATFDILSDNLLLTSDIIFINALKHDICPFEFALHLASLSDVVVCDYNYVFDPLVSLKGLFESNERFTFLIDEAHNLPERAREMFSKTLYKSNILIAKRSVDKKHKPLIRALNRVNRNFLELKKEITDNTKIFEYIPDKLLRSIQQLTMELAIFLSDNKNEILLELYLDCLSFSKISEYYDNRFKFIFEKISKNDCYAKIYNLDPSYQIDQVLSKSISAHFFTATFTPFTYFKYMLSCKSNDYTLKLSSPFPKENLKILLNDEIRLNYKYREQNIPRLSKYLFDIISTNPNKNAIIFFPSYSFMETVFKQFPYLDNTQYIIQKKQMDDMKREEFLSEFKEDSNPRKIGFCVMGGVFSEGIDLKGNRLSIVCIVSVALPGISTERNLIKNFFNSQGKDGFDYAYTYNGVNKLMQAAGRVIRTSEDIGLLCFIDKRFSSKKYRKFLSDSYTMPSHFR